MRRSLRVWKPIGVMLTPWTIDGAAVVSVSTSDQPTRPSSVSTFSRGKPFTLVGRIRLTLARCHRFSSPCSRMHSTSVMRTGLAAIQSPPR